MWKMLQKKNHQDYVISTGKQYSVKDFINLSLNELKYKILLGKVRELMKNAIHDKGNCIIECDKEYFRPLEVDTSVRRL